MGVQALERSAGRPAVEARAQRRAAVGPRAARIELRAQRSDARIGASRGCGAAPGARRARARALRCRRPTRARRRRARATRHDSQNVVGNGVARLVVGALGDHARPAVRAARRNAGERTRRPAELALDRLAVTFRRSFHGPQVWQPGGAPAQTAKPCACRPALAPARTQRPSAPRAATRRGGAAAAARRALHRAGALVPARALRHAAAAHRGRAARPAAREAAGRAGSASQTTAMIAQARAEGYIRPGEKPFALTP